ncbi:MAG: peptidoglycan DD-metalloendopeptidase family protein [Gammaproteobacteria bacterium]|nr:peptidoglycan DD-metalloendopeptidase family protein [Gammaproteobacteria bacterium]
MIRLIAVLLLAVAALSAQAQEAALRPGGIAILDLGDATEPPPDVRYGDKPALLYEQDGRLKAAIGLPLDLKPGKVTVKVGNDDREIDVSAHAYREQRLTVKNQSYVTPDPVQLERIGRERKIIDAAINNYRPATLDGIALQTPVDGPRSSSFGLRRFFNDQPRSPHKGMDIAAGEGTAIIAPRPGVVTATGDYFFNGNTIIVDHGQGLVTLYCHLSEIAVNEGDELGTGEKLGAVGSTGRVTGPHLHFGVYLNGTAIDPAILLSN